MATHGTVRVWHLEEGWGVVDSTETPGGCWFHFSTVLSKERGIELRQGQRVRFRWEAADQDGYRYRALSINPETA